MNSEECATLYRLLVKQAESLCSEAKLQILVRRPHCTFFQVPLTAIDC